MQGHVEGRPTQSVIEVAPWSDIVQASMGRGIAGTYAQMARTCAIYLATGTLRRLMRLRRGPVIAALYPVAVLLVQLALALAVGAAVWAAARTGLAAALGPGLTGLTGAVGLPGIGLDTTGMAAVGLHSTGLAGIGPAAVGLDATGLDATGLVGIGPDAIGQAPVGLDSIGLDMTGMAGFKLAGLGLAGVGLEAIGLAAGAAAAWGVLWLGRRLDGRLFAYYLMHDYAFTAAHLGAYPPELEARLSLFRARLQEILDEGPDEVLVVGHSSGAYLAVSLLADLLRARADTGPDETAPAAPPTPARPLATSPPAAGDAVATTADPATDALPPAGPALSLLTLGQVVPMASFLPGATRLRGDLALLSRARGIFWLDVTAPGDACCFALCDPVAVSGLGGPEQRWPLVVSAAFTRTLSPERRAAMRFRWFRRHFQYLCAFDRPGDYDYFAITAGPQTLARRFAGRAPSPGRITRPAGAR